MKSRTLVCALLSLLGACGPMNPPADATNARDSAAEAGPDGSTGDVPAADVPSIDVPDFDAWRFNPPDAPAEDARYDARSDAPRGTCETMPLREIDARTRVRFRFAPSSGFVAFEGDGCLPMVMRRPGPTEEPVELALDRSCACECPRPSSSVRTIVSLDAPREFVWDGREMRSCTVAVDCATRGWPSLGWGMEQRGFLQPVAPGRYRAIFAAYDTPPPYCMPSGTDGRYTCSGGGSGGYGGYPANALCTTSRTIAVEFDVPESGEVVVDVSSTGSAM